VQIGANEEIKKEEFAVPLKKRDKKKKEKDSDAGSAVSSSVISAVTNKTKSGAITKHCGLCGNKPISGANWNKHTKTHGE